MRYLSRASVFVLIFLFSPCSLKAEKPLSVVVNEIAWAGTPVSYNDEWIELHNNTDSKINLSNWRLAAQDGTPEIILTGVILANGFYLLERTDDETVPGIAADQIYTGALGNDGETLNLYDNSGNLIDTVNCSAGWFAGDNSTKQTMERVNPEFSGNETSNWQNSQNPGGTPKAQNSTPLAAELEFQPEPTTPPVKEVYPGGILINEILPSPTGPDETEEWIEIFNQNNFGVNLTNWKITDTIGGKTTYTFPEGTEISSQVFLLLVRPTTKITLNNDGDGLSLIRPDGEIVETINYPKAPRGQSFNRSDKEWSWSVTLTPRATNILSPVETSKIAEEGLEQAETNLSGPKISLAEKEGLASLTTKSLNLSKSSFVFLVAPILAIFSGTLILIIKKKIL